MWPWQPAPSVRQSLLSSSGPWHQIEASPSILCCAHYPHLILDHLLLLLRAQLTWKKELPMEMFEETSYVTEYEFNFPHTQYDVVS